MNIFRSIRVVPLIHRSCPIVDRAIFTQARKLTGVNSKNSIFLSFHHSSVPCPLTCRKKCYNILFCCGYGSIPHTRIPPFYKISERLLCTSSLSPSDLKKAIDDLTDQFMEARELLEDARESVDTVYFSEDMKEATESVTQTLEDYQKLLEKLSDVQRQEVLRTIGLKMEELKAQQQALLEDH